MSRVLVVDDHDGVRQGLLLALRHLGHEAVAVADGREALARLQAEHFDVLLTDLQMPGMNGLELLRELGETHAPGHRFVMSGSEEPELLASAAVLADAVYRKPLDLAVLREMLTAGATHRS